ncbi:MAG: Uncharacterized protein G01um101470_748 [Parcubacteria group bacterium Gr01-1014_70]|nr:MAG: Uncharacterized protein G01um101470_748 [Parcubacteria group bacterium Gr01-1014_70]
MKLETYKKIKEVSFSHASRFMLRTSRKGFTLIEILVYGALLAFMIALMANSIGSLSHLVVEAKTERAVRSSAEAALERITREIRFAASVNTGASTLGTHPGTLVLTSIDPFTETAQTITISVTNNRVSIQKNANPVEYLTSDDTTVTNFVFRRVANGTRSESVRTELTIGGEKFYNTTVLRRSY